MVSILNLPHFSVLTILALFALSPVPLRANDDENDDPTEFCYTGKCGPDTDFWGGECKTGQHQSPIDLSITTQVKTSITKATLDFNAGYSSNGMFYLILESETF